MAQPAVIVEPVEPATLTDMLDGGWRLLHEQPGTVLALSAMCLVPATVLTWILTLLPSALAEGLPWGARWAVNSVVSALAAMLTAGPLVTASVLLYLDLRVRTEGLDLRQRATVAFSRAG